MSTSGDSFCIEESVILPLLIFSPLIIKLIQLVRMDIVSKEIIGIFFIIIVQVCAIFIIILVFDSKLSVSMQYISSYDSMKKTHAFLLLYTLIHKWLGGELALKWDYPQLIHSSSYNLYL